MESKIEEKSQALTYDEVMKAIKGQVIEEKRVKKHLLKTLSFHEGAFWGLWKARKNEIKYLGFSPNKGFDGKWKLSHWSEITTEHTQKLLPEVEKCCLPYQVEHVKNLVNILQKHQVALDASDTGTGKTFAALLVAKQLNLRPTVLCPLSVKRAWVDALHVCGFFDYTVENYERVRRADTDLYRKTKDGRKTVIEWGIGKKDILIMDEAHKVSNPKTLQGRMGLSAVRSGIFTLMLSATAVLDPIKMGTISECLGLHGASFHGHNNFLTEFGCIKGKFGWEFHNSAHNLKKLHLAVFPQHAARMRISEIPMFPETQIMANPITVDEKATKVIDNAHRELIRLAIEIRQLRDDQAKQGSAAILVQILRMRQAIEAAKMPLFAELILEALEEQKHVAVFLNFRDSIALLENYLQEKKIPYGKIQGGQSLEERDKSITEFQKDKIPVVLCAIQAGGVGVSLHDTLGNFPRVALISPTWSAAQMQQTLGRVWRSGGLTKSTQRIVFAADTVEEEISRKVKGKIDNLGKIQDAEKFNSIFEFEETT